MLCTIQVSEVEFIKCNFHKLGVPYEYFNDRVTNNKQIYKELYVNAEIAADQLESQRNKELPSLKI